MTTPRMPMQVVITDDSGAFQPITNTGVVVDGVEFRLSAGGWTGWSDTPDVRAAPEDLPGGDGSYDDAPLFGSRLIVGKGVALADTPRQLLAAERRWKALLTRGGRIGTVAVTQGEADWVEAWQAQVRLNGSSTFEKTHPHRAEWTIALFAADPRLYSTTPSSTWTRRFVPSAGLTLPLTLPVTFGAVGTAGRIQVHNDGDIPTGVLLEVVGQCLNPRIALIETGQRIALMASVPDGVTVDTNTRNRSVTRNGSPFGYTLTSDSDLFELPPGDSTLLFLADAGDPTLTATWSAATL